MRAVARCQRTLRLVLVEYRELNGCCCCGRLCGRSKVGSLATQLRQGLSGRGKPAPAAAHDVQVDFAFAPTSPPQTDHDNTNDNDNENDDDATGARGGQASLDICCTAPVHS